MQRLRGKWWLVGSSWSGRDADGAQQEEAASRQLKNVDQGIVDKLMAIARKQGLNTNIRRTIFVVLLTSQDYCDAEMRLERLALTELQQREICRVIVHCAQMERTYNPYYSLLARRLSAKKRNFQITFRVVLQDVLRTPGLPVPTDDGDEIAFEAEFNSSSRDIDVNRKKLANIHRFYTALTQGVNFKPSPRLSMLLRCIDGLINNN